MANGVSTATIALEVDLAQKRKVIDQFDSPMGEVTVVAGHDSLWFEVIFEGRGGVALRTGYLLGNQLQSVEKEAGYYHLRFPAGTIRVEADFSGEIARVKTYLTPEADVVLPYFPRDFYPIDRQGDPNATSGRVHTMQTELAVPVVYLSLEQPKVGSYLYFQNFNSLNPYFEAIGKPPKEAVGGNWPELGYLPPTSTDKPMKAGEEIMLSDAMLVFDPQIPADSNQMGRQFLDLLAKIYLQLERPTPGAHNWLEIIQPTIKDLSRAPTASVTHWGEKYLRPYNDAEYPDSMCQANLVHGLVDYQIWSGKNVPLADKLKKGVSRFYDRKYQIIRRYLPNVGKDKDRAEVDGWYVLHPLMSLARLAKDGDKDARELFFRGLPAAVKFAHQFKYLWPVLWDLETGEVKRAERREGKPGQTDVAGLYAYVMMQAHEITPEDRGDERKKYIEEATKSLVAIHCLGFDLAYQSNITAWGVAACARVFKATEDPKFLDIACHFAGAFFRNSVLWESELQHAKNYKTFMGVLCLDKGPYMAVFECHEAFEAFGEALTLTNGYLPESLRLLMAEYCRFALSRTWSYLPMHLPKEVLSKQVKNGKIDPKLHFPLEDMYIDGQAAGQIGQEVYGAGTIFAVVTNAYQILENAPAVLFCDYPIQDLKVDGTRATLNVVGVRQCSCRLQLMPWGRRKMPALEVWVDGDSMGRGTEFEVPGGSNVELRW